MTEQIFDPITHLFRETQVNVQVNEYIQQLIPRLTNCDDGEVGSLFPVPYSLFQFLFPYSSIRNMEPVPYSALMTSVPYSPLMNTE